MPSPTDFNVSPYYDDFSEAKNFHRILFRPAFAVQARELTQSQTILQDQIDLSFLSISPDKQISNKSSQVKTIKQEGITKLLEVLSPINITSIVTNHRQSTKKNEFGILNIKDIGNNGYLYFKSFSPNSILL